MESLSNTFDGRALLFTDDSDFSINGVLRDKHMLRKSDGEDAVGNMGFMEPLLPNVVKRPFLSDDADNHLGKPAVSNSIMGFGTSLSNDEKFASPKDSSGKDNVVLPRLEPSVSVKRSRITNIQTTVPTCQVYGCNKDLSSSKDYHKRHKVCDAHSKTPVVIVNGIQQRFCQQCSRFHKLAEFDEGKRSCRKRLAGHNERRRKPQFDTRLGSTYIATDESRTSVIFSRILPGGFFNLQYNEPVNHITNLKLEDDAKFGQSLPRSVLRFQECSASSDSASALSLLSTRSQSHNISRNSEEISTAHPLICKENRHANSPFTLEDSATHLGEISSSGNFPLFIPNSSEELNPLKLKGHPSPEAPNSVSLLELSLRLQRVEQQKYYGQVKLENGFFCDSTMT